MERKTAVAAATAVSMTVLSATFAVAASVGALGFGVDRAPRDPAGRRDGAGRVRARPPRRRSHRSGAVSHEAGEHEGRDSGSGGDRHERQPARREHLP